MFRILFTDSKFSQFITTQIAGALYVILAWIVAVGSVLQAVLGLIQGNFVLIFAPLAGLAAIVLLRIATEAGVALIKIAENTRR